MRYVLHTLLLAFSLLSGLATVSAQQVPILFEETKWNFGDVQESGGSVEHTFVFTNVSDRPVVIVDVSTGCGCTTPKYSRKPVLAGAKGEIVVAFDPINRPGHFSKGVSVMTSASKEPVLLQVEGNVVPREKTLEEHFPGIVRRCRKEGYDVLREPVPVVPAQHYFMGGVRSDLSGRTTAPHLYAVGETCCNGVHGRNRLASNSLLEALIFARRAAQDITDGGRAKGKTVWDYTQKEIAAMQRARRRLVTQETHHESE